MVLTLWPSATLPPATLAASKEAGGGGGGGGEGLKDLLRVGLFAPAAAALLEAAADDAGFWKDLWRVVVVVAADGGGDGEGRVWAEDSRSCGYSETRIKQINHGVRTVKTPQLFPYCFRSLHSMHRLTSPDLLQTLNYFRFANFLQMGSLA